MSSAANVFERHYQFCTPITGGAHEAWSLVGSEDTSFEITLDIDYALIIKLENTGDMSEAGDFQLQYNVDAAGWNDVNASSSNVRTAASGDADDATSATERLTAVTETFAASVLDEGDGLQVRNMSGHEAAEYYFAFNFRSAELSGGETITFQLLAGGSDSITHSVVPTAIVPASADITIPVPVGTLTLSGLVPTAIRTENHVIPVAAGSLTLTGLAPLAISPISIAVPIGSMTFSGEIPTLVQTDNHIRAPPVGSLTFTGLVPNRGTGLRLIGYVPTVSISGDIVIAVPAGSMTLSGLQPTAARTDNHEIPVPVGSLAFSGKIPSLERSWVASPDSGTLTATGYAPLLIQTFSIDVPAGSLALTGFAPTAINSGDGNITIAVPAGSLVLTGTAPTAVHTNNHVIAVPAGSLTLTGEPPAWNIDIVGAEGSLLLQGYVPTLIQTFSIPVPVGSLSLSGQQPTLISGDDKIAQPSAGSLSLTGFAPTLVQTDDHIIPVATGALVLSGAAPVLETTVPIAAGALAFTGYAPGIVIAEGIAVPVGSLVLTGQIPALIRTENHVIAVPAGSLSLTGFAPSVEITHIRQPATGTAVFTGFAPGVEIDVTLGDVFNAAAIFPTLSTITIELFDSITGAVIALDSNVCPEIGTEGLYIWDSSKLTTQPSGYQEYAWKMTDGITFEGGVIRINAMSVDDLFAYVMENGETYAEQIRLIRADAAGAIVQLPNGKYKIKSADGLTDRIEGDDAPNDGRTISSTDGA